MPHLLHNTLYYDATNILYEIKESLLFIISISAQKCMDSKENEVCGVPLHAHAILRHSLVEVRLESH